MDLRSYLSRLMMSVNPMTYMPFGKPYCLYPIIVLKYKLTNKNDIKIIEQYIGFACFEDNIFSWNMLVFCDGRVTFGKILASIENSKTFFSDNSSFSSENDLIEWLFYRFDLRNDDWKDFKFHTFGSTFSPLSKYNIELISLR